MSEPEIPDYSSAGATAKRMMLALVALFMDVPNKVSVNALTTSAAFFCKCDGFTRDQFITVCKAAWELVSSAEREADAEERLALGYALGNKFNPPKEGEN